MVLKNRTSNCAFHHVSCLQQDSIKHKKWFSASSVFIDALVGGWSSSSKKRQSREFWLQEKGLSQHLHVVRKQVMSRRLPWKACFQIVHTTTSAFICIIMMMPCVLSSC
jgi:hypothetical protein